MAAKQDLASLLEKARGQRVLCIGDVMLDRFVYGSVDRISPESPVPVLHRTRTAEMPGGAGNVARNLASMGLEVVMIGLAGEDHEGERLEALLKGHAGISPRLVHSKTYQTVVKSRFVANNQQLLRVDTEQAVPEDEAITRALIDAIRTEAMNCRAVVISDYAKGCITPQVFAAAVQAARAQSIPLLVDPKSLDFSVYAGATLIKPNAAELASATGLLTARDEDVEAALKAAQAIVPDSSIIVTRAGKGMSWLESGVAYHRRGEARQVFDVSGAGDTSMAAITLGVVAEAGLEDAVALAVTASGIAVGKTGTATVDADEIRRALRPQDNLLRAAVLAGEDLSRQVQSWKSAGLRVGFTNGCFDILHAGHLKLLEESKSRCDRLIVAINTDASVKRLKGPSRPVNHERDRASLLASIGLVDAVTLFGEDTPADLIERLKPDLLVKGGDYTPETIVGAETVLAHGGEVHIVGLVEDISTTAILARSKD